MSQETPSTSRLAAERLDNRRFGRFWIGSLAIAIWQIIEKQEGGHLWIYFVPRARACLCSSAAWRDKTGAGLSLGWTLHGFLTYANPVIGRLSKQSIEAAKKRDRQNANHDTLQDILELGRDAKKHFADNKQIADVVDGVDFLAHSSASGSSASHFAAFLQASKTLSEKTQPRIPRQWTQGSRRTRRRILDAVPRTF